jgi:hypothetical protein
MMRLRTRSLLEISPTSDQPKRDHVNGEKQKDSHDSRGLGFFAPASNNRLPSRQEGPTAGLQNRWRVARQHERPRSLVRRKKRGLYSRADCLEAVNVVTLFVVRTGFGRSASINYGSTSTAKAQQSSVGVIMTEPINCRRANTAASLHFPNRY